MIFEELHEPRKETVGVHKGMWFVQIIDGDMCLVNDFSYQILNVENTEEGNDKFYFKSILDAFSCSSAYYMTHGTIYPYTDDWLLSQGNNVEVNVVSSDSQIMEFI